MNKFIILLLPLFITLIQAAKEEGNIKNIVVFGDSYSDVGNKQRLSNGPLWNEHLAVGWQASLYSFAFSGAVCDNDMYKQQEESYIPSIVDQVEMYYHQNISLKPEETAVIFWVGVNDIYKIFEEKPQQQQQKELTKVVECISTNIRNVRRVFSNNKFIVFGVPPLERMPYYANSEDTDMTLSREKAANSLNEQLTKELEKMNKHLANLELDLVDIHQLLNDIVDQPEVFNIKNTQDPYWDTCQGKCNDDIDSYVWWDKTHLTGGIHRLIASSILMAGSLSPETYLEDNLDVKSLLEPYKSPIYKAVKNKGEIDKVIQQLNEIQQEQQGVEDDLFMEEEDKAPLFEDKSYVFYAITATVIVSVGFILFVKTKRRRGASLNSLSNLLKSNKDTSTRGRFVPLQNLDSEV